MNIPKTEQAFNNILKLLHEDLKDDKSITDDIKLLFLFWNSNKKFINIRFLKSLKEIHNKREDYFKTYESYEQFDTQLKEFLMPIIHAHVDTKYPEWRFQKFLEWFIYCKNEANFDRTLCSKQIAISHQIPIPNN